MKWPCAACVTGPIPGLYPWAYPWATCPRAWHPGGGPSWQPLWSQSAALQAWHPTNLSITCLDNAPMSPASTQPSRHKKLNAPLHVLFPFFSRWIHWENPSFDLRQISRAIVQGFFIAARHRYCVPCVWVAEKSRRMLGVAVRWPPWGGVGLGRGGGGGGIPSCPQWDCYPRLDAKNREYPHSRVKYPGSGGQPTTHAVLHPGLTGAQ